MWSKRYWVNFFLIYALASQDNTQAATHPLDALSTSEVHAVVTILKKSGLMHAQSLMPYLLLKEPPKSEVIVFRPGKTFRRESLVILYDSKAKKLQEITVDLTRKKITEQKEILGQHPPVMLSEFEAAPKIVKADPRFKQAMLRRGIKNLEDVLVDVWAYGSPTQNMDHEKRFLRAIAYFKGNGKNFYSRPIDGFTAIVNMSDHRVEEIIDTDVFPIPPVLSDLDPKSIGATQPALKPLNIVQPKGPSFRVRGQEIEWGPWKFRYSMHPREGLVLHLVQIKDQGKWRSVLYRASLSEMMVPYGSPDQHWTYRAAFDEGEYGIGRYSGSLEPGTDAPLNAKFLDAQFVDDFGKPYTTKKAVMLYERDGGLLWKHYDMYLGGNYSRRARELVIGFITTISNYDYGLNWVFKQDGSITLEAQLTGIMLAKNTQERIHGDHGFGHAVAPHVVAPHHQHFFNMRLDLDVDGPTNQVLEMNTHPVGSSEPNPLFNAFKMEEVTLKSEKNAARNMDFSAQRKWKVFNPKRINSLGYASGYILIPGENASPYLQEGSPLLIRGGFIKNHFWATQQDEQELYAAGSYPLQRGSEDGLPLWIQKDRSLENKDLVVWYNFCVTHAPRPEEWPVMNVHKTGFTLAPAGFFEKNPALNVPK